MSPVDFQARIDAFVSEVTGEFHPGESGVKRFFHAVTAGSALIGDLVDAVDEENRAVEIENLKVQAKKAARDAIDGMSLPVYISAPAQAVIPTVVPMAIDAAAEKSSVIVKLRDEKLVPSLESSIALLQGVLKAIAPDAEAPPVSP